MTDEDTIERIAFILGRILDKPITIREFDRQHRVNRENHSSLYKVQLTGTDARYTMRLIVPFMSNRRRAKIWQSLNKYTAPKLKLADMGFNIVSLMKKGT